MRGALPATALALVLLTAPAAHAQQVSGRLFEDRDADGIRDPGEPALTGVDVRLYGTASGGGAVDAVVPTAADGAWAFAPGDGCYLVAPAEPPGYRLTGPRRDGVPEGTPGYTQPVGMPRFSVLDRGVEHLAGGALRYAALGDSIAWNFNFCGYPESFWYSKRLRDRLACVAPGATVTLDQAAVKGEHSDDLLVDDTDDLNNVFRMIEAQPELITISMIGNDLLDVDPPSSPTQAEIDRAVTEVLDARRNLQEALSTLVSEIPGADVALNSLYDNETYNCYSGDPSAFHRAWLPIVNRILRDLAWGQARRVTINEVRAEFAHEDQLAACAGFDGLICRDVFGLDRIHPTNPGFEVVLEKVWEAAGGVQLGAQDAQERPSIDDVDYGYLRRVRRLLPTAWEARDGALVSAGDAALDDDDGGAAATVELGAGSEELRLTGFPDWFDEIEIVRVVAGVRYATSGVVGDDAYRIEASVDGAFTAPPGHAYTPTDWNFVTPIVGGGGPNAPAANPDYPGARLLAVPDVAAPREVSATLTKNPVLPAGAADYEWPAVTHEELATTAIRVVSAPLAGTPGNDAYAVELDGAWLDLYGWERPRPGQVEALRLDARADGGLDLSFLPPAGATRHNVYVGRLSTLRGGAYDHGAALAPSAPACDVATTDAGGGRLAATIAAGQVPSASSYWLVTSHVDDVESPAGVASDGVEIDRSQASCR